MKRYAALDRALIDAKTQNGDLFAAVEGVLPWNELAASVAEAETLAQPGEFHSLAFMTNSYQCSVAMCRSSWRLSSSGQHQGLRNLCERWNCFGS